MIMLIRFLFILIWFLIPSLSVQLQKDNSHPSQKKDAPFNYESTAWADSVFNSLSADERLGQLFMMAAYSNQGYDEKQRITALINQNKIGGLIFMQGSPAKQASLTNYYQSISKVPLMIGIDGEWGLSMRLDSTILFPRQQTLGAIQNNDLLFQFGQELGKECSRIGVNVDFAPDVDVNNNPLNPVIGDRSFGDNKFNVAAKGIAVMQGMQQYHVLACAKHFPGHGNVDKDSHKTLPTVNGSKQELFDLELYPFMQMIDSGVGSIMVAHLNVPALDSTGIASTLSKTIVTKLLRDSLGFNGLIFTDALNMKGVSDTWGVGDVDVRALIAGNDVLLYSGNVPLAISKIKEALAAGSITQQEIDAHVKKILQAKFWMGLNHFKPIQLEGITDDFLSPKTQLLKMQLVENALTLVKNNNQIIPLKNLDTLKIASVDISESGLTEFSSMLKQFAPVTTFSISKNSSADGWALLENKLANYNLIIVGVHEMNRSASSNYGITEATKNFISIMQTTKKVVAVTFGSPYALNQFENCNALLCAYSNDTVNQNLSAQLLFGAIRAKGKLPVTASSVFKSGMGLITTQVIRMKYSIPEEVGLNSSEFSKLDDIAIEAIDQHATPGCQIMVVKDNTVIYQKSFGYHTYDDIDKVQNDDLYDIASVTKIASTTMCVMNLVNQGLLDVNKTVSDYLPEFAGTNKADIPLTQILTHTAGLKPWIPFYKETLDDAGNLKPTVYNPIPTKTFSLEVTPDIYMNRIYVDTMWQRIIQSPVEDYGSYKYSDLDFYIMKAIVERITNVPIDQYVKNNFYSPLGLSTIGFLPLQHFSKDRIVPSNYDNVFRHQLIWGTVHDQGAAMLGGVAGHAGIFSDANDLAVIMQMLLNHGEYGGKKYLDSSTVEKFTEQHSKVCRRGLGFDKPEPNPNKSSPACEGASCNAYGHQGFTGTCVWADPNQNLIYVFLSNRTYPDDENQKINSMGIRNRIWQAVYDIIKNDETN